jgi:hypothetical protein
MKRRVEIENPQSRGELEAVVRNVWDDLTLDTINALVAEMPRRLIEVIRNEGRSIQILRQRGENTLVNIRCNLNTYRTKVRGHHQTRKFSRLSVQRMMDMTYLLNRRFVCLLSSPQLGFFLHLLLRNPQM